jgi:hypothetical protein
LRELHLLVRPSCGGNPEQQAHIEMRSVGKVGQERAVAADCGAGFTEALGEAIERAAHRRRGRQQRMGVDDEHPEALQVVVARRRQRQPIGDAVTRLVRTGEHAERQGEVGRAARHRSDHSEIDVAWHGRDPRRRVSARRHEIERRLMPIDAAIMRRHAQRAGDVGTDRQRSEAGGERRGRPA